MASEVREAEGIVEEAEVEASALLLLRIARRACAHQVAETRCVCNPRLHSHARLNVHSQVHLELQFLALKRHGL